MYVTKNTKSVIPVSQDGILAATPYVKQVTLGEAGASAVWLMSLCHHSLSTLGKYGVWSVERRPGYGVYGRKTGSHP
jgi:hypothetical protein